MLPQLVDLICSLLVMPLLFYPSVIFPGVSDVEIVSYLGEEPKFFSL